jgi:hypothetical protein
MLEEIPVTPTPGATLPKGKPRALEERTSEIDRRIAQFKAEKQRILAAQAREQKKAEEYQIRTVGLAVLRVRGSFKESKFLAWIEPGLISDKERAALGFDPLPQDEKKRRLSQFREVEEEWRRREGDKADSVSGEPNPPVGT